MAQKWRYPRFLPCVAVSPCSATWGGVPCGMGQAKRRQKEIEALKNDNAADLSTLKFNITESDVKQAIDMFVSLLPTLKEFDGLKLKPSEIVSPITLAILRTTSEGFPISMGDDLHVFHDDTADVLRSIFQRYRSGESTPEQFSSTALPLILELRSQVQANEAEELQDLIADTEEDGKEPN